MKEITLEDLGTIGEYILSETAYIFEQDEDQQQQQEFSELVKAVTDGQKYNEIKQLDTYKQILNMVNSIKYQNNESKEKMTDFCECYGMFLYILNNVQDDKAKEIANRIQENLMKLPDVVKKAQQNGEGRLSVDADTQNQIKSIRDALKKILPEKKTDKAQADRDIKDLIQKYPRAKNAIQAKYDNY